MTRAERRRRRELWIRRRWRLRYSQEGYDWEADTAAPWYGWDIMFREPGRYAKYNGTCKCLHCRMPWSHSRRRKDIDIDLFDCGDLIRHHNRLYRWQVPGRFKRGPTRGTRV